jgi:hypothetical protein
MYKPINGWTKESIVKRLWWRNTGKKSGSIDRKAGFQCRYRGDNGNACAVGCFIPDDLYHPSMEGLSVVFLLKDFPLAKSMPLQIEALDRLQHEHDSAVGDPREAMIDWVNKNVE